MNKKLFGTLAVVSLALFGCGNDDTAKKDTTAPASTESSAGTDNNREHKSANDIIEGIKNNSGDKDARPSIELGMNSGVQWKDGGYKAPLEDGKATITGDTTGEKVFIVKDGDVVEELPLENGAFSYEAEGKDGDVFYFVADDRLSEDDKDVDLEDADRAEEITLVEE